MANVCCPEFQRIYTPNAFREERVLWRSVIQLNIVRSIRIMLDAVQDVRRHELQAVSSDTEYDDYSDQPVGLPPHLHAICMRLLPLRHVETLLIAKLVPPNEDEATHLGISDSGYDPHSYRKQEVFVRPTTTWKGAQKKQSNGSGRPSSAGTTGIETPEESQAVLHQCRNDMIALWNDRTVKDILKKRKIRLEESPGLYVCAPSFRPSHPHLAYSYLDDLERVTSLSYLPSDGGYLPGF